jgi:DNA segregation ATPase FtsK/SpoIIIE-like protein
LHEDDTKPQLPLSGQLISTVISHFCQKPIQNDDSWEPCSIGVAENSVVATDMHSAVLIGDNAVHHVATQRKSALLEAARAKIYGVSAELSQIDRNTAEGGEAKPMPHVQKVIRQNLATMKAIAIVDPAALVGVGKLAVAAGASSVELYQPDGDPHLLGFVFKFDPDPKHINLFNPWEGQVEARGVFRARSGAARAAEEVEQEVADAEAAVSGASNGKPAKEAPVTLEVVAGADPVPQPEPEPEMPVDITAAETRGAYTTPALTILEQREETEVDTGNYGPEILETLRSFGMSGRIEKVHAGPTVTQYELAVPPNIAVKKIAAMESDFQHQLGVKSVRIEAPIPGKKAIGIEIPNKVARTVSLFELATSRRFVDAEARLTLALGQDVSGRPVYANLAATPHLLIGGATGAGKSIGIASILSSLLLRNAPHEMRLVLIDPKQVELSLFEDLPHLMCPVITSTLEVPGVLRALVREMERRYDLLKDAKARDFTSYNSKVEETACLPLIVIVIDELADLMMQAKAEIEPSIVRLLQKARAAGMHMIIATQRPSTDVITGLIKANVPSRIAYAVASGIDSQVILDSRGAEKLLGRGDMLYSPIDGGGKTTRIQGAYVSEEEVGRIVEHWRAQGAPFYDIKAQVEEVTESGDEDGPDVLYSQAVQFVIERGQASTSMLQRRFEIGFQRSSRLLDQMESDGVVGPRDGPRPRQVLKTLEEVGA